MSASEIPLPVQFRLNGQARWILTGSSACLTAVILFALVEGLHAGQLWLSVVLSVCLGLWILGVIRALRLNVVFLDDSIHFKKGLWAEYARSYEEIVRLRLRPDRATVYFADGVQVSVTALDGDLLLVGEIVGPRGAPTIQIEVEEF